jgi:serine/threonine protein kinase
MRGDTIGQYRIGDVIGSGGMGVVYSAEHTLIGRAAAVKVLLPEFSQNQAIVQRFFNEAKAATAIRHPGIVEILDFGWHTDGSAYIVMEHLDGETLTARSKRAQLTWQAILAITRQIAGALGAAHKKGIVHRDLKRIQLLEDSEGGASAHERIVYDSQLAVECAPGLAADGTQRCLPDPLSYAQAAGHFRDAGCTQPITLTGVSAPTCTSHPVRFVGEVTGDLTGPRIFRAGPKYPGPVYGGGPSSCQLYQGTEFYPEGTELPPEMFSLVTQQTDP